MKKKAINSQKEIVILDRVSNMLIVPGRGFGRAGV
jgi:hypothetical protein